MNQNVISKKPKAKKDIIHKLYFLFFYIKHLSLLLADGVDDVSAKNNDGKENAEDNDIDVGDGNNGEVRSSHLQRRQLTKNEL